VSASDQACFDGTCPVLHTTQLQLAQALLHDLMRPCILALAIPPG
jgi:hypothetical protein